MAAYLVANSYLGIMPEAARGTLNQEEHRFTFRSQLLK